MIKKITHFLRLKRNALNYKVPFHRRASFQIPNVIAGNRKIAFPNEHGAKCDFIEVFLGDAYRIRSIRKRLQRVIDVGANVGFFSVAAKLTFPDAEIHAYEPFTKLSNFLEPNAHEFSFKVFYEAVEEGTRESLVCKCLAIRIKLRLKKEEVTRSGKYQLIRLSKE